MQMPEFSLGSLRLTMAVPIDWVITGIAILIMIFVRFAAKNFKEIPRGFQNVIELFVELAENAAKSRIHNRHFGAVVPYLLVLGLYISLNALSELLGITPPISSLSATLAMGIFTFIWINWYAFRAHGFFGRFVALARPVAFVAPFKIITDLAIPISMACRLFGNMIAGIIVMTLIYSVIPIIVPSIFAAYFNIIHATIQGYIFIVLTLSFIEENIQEE